MGLAVIIQCTLLHHNNIIYKIIYGVKTVQNILLIIVDKLRVI